MHHHLPLLLLLLSLPHPTTSQSGTHLHWPSQTYKSFPWPAPLLSFTKPLGPSSVTPGHLFFAPIASDASKAGWNVPLIMTDEGELVWRPETDEWNGTRNFDLQEMMGAGAGAGEEVLTWWAGDHNAGYGCGYGAVVVLDGSYTQRYNVCMADLPVVPIPGTFISQPCLLDSHESRITSRGTLLASVRNVTQADLSAQGGATDGYLLDSQFYEINITTQEVILRWSAYEHNDQLDMLSLSATKPDKKSNPRLPWDYFHMNSIYDVPEPLGGYLVSSRYLSSAIKLDREGNVEWYLEGTTGGNFTLPATATFSFQHCLLSANETSTSLTLTMFDNANKDNSNPKRESSGLALELDLTTHTATLVRRVQPDNFTATPHTGSYQSLPGGHVFVDYGHPPVFNEYDADGNIVYVASASSVEGEIYRAYRKNFTTPARPTTSPSIYAETTSDGKTTVYMSWNGATDVAAWQLAAGTSCDTVTAVQSSYPKTGFETVVELQGTLTHVQALAMGSQHGVLLGRSMLVATDGGNSSAGADGESVVSCGEEEAIGGLSTVSATAMATATSGAAVTTDVATASSFLSASVASTTAVPSGLSGGATTGEATSTGGTAPAQTPMGALLMAGVAALGMLL